MLFYFEFNKDPFELNPELRSFREFVDLEPAYMAFVILYADKTGPLRNVKSEALRKKISAMCAGFWMVQAGKVMITAEGRNLCRATPKEIHRAVKLYEELQKESLDWLTDEMSGYENMRREYVKVLNNFKAPNTKKQFEDDLNKERMKLAQAIVKGDYINDIDNRLMEWKMKFERYLTEPLSEQLVSMFDLDIIETTEEMEDKISSGINLVDLKKKKDGY